MLKILQIPEGFYYFLHLQFLTVLYFFLYPTKIIQNFIYDNRKFMDITLPSKGKLLIAEPSIIGDISFNRAVILLEDYNENGSVGLILNKPLEFKLKDFIPEVTSDLPVYNGGPVEQDNLYFIHCVPDLIPDSINISEGIYWCGDFDTILRL